MSAPHLGTLGRQGSSGCIRAAVCVSGGVANVNSLRAFRDSLDEKLFRTSPSCEFHIFVFARLPGEMSAAELEKELKPLTTGGSDSSVWIHRVVVEDESNCKDESKIRVDHPHYSYSAPFEFNQFNTLSMYWKLHVVDQYRRRYEFETGISFDAVVRTRPDLVLHDAIDLAALDFSHRLTVHLPWFSSSMRLAFDQLGIGPPEAMRAYAKAYYNVPHLTQSSALTLGFHPEHTLFMHLLDSNISLQRMQCRTSIARRSQSSDPSAIESVDSFARLRSEFGSAALACEEEYFDAAPAPMRIDAEAAHAAAHSPPLSPRATHASSAHSAFGSPQPAAASGHTRTSPSHSPQSHGTPSHLPPSGGGGWLAASAAPAAQAGRPGERLGERLAVIEEAHAWQRDVLTQTAGQVAQLTGQLQHEQALRVAAESRLASALQHNAELRGLCSLVVVCFSVVGLGGAYLASGMARGAR